MARYINLPGGSGNYVNTPDANDWDITGDIDIVACVEATDWTPSAAMVVWGKWNDTGSQRSYFMRLTTAGKLDLTTTVLGITSVTTISTVATGAADGTPLWIRATEDVSSGADRVNKFYTSTDAITTPIASVTWTQLGTTVTTSGGTTSIFSGTALPAIGAVTGGTVNIFTGKFYCGALYNGYDGAGSLIASPDVRTLALGISTFVENGHTWTFQGTAAMAGILPGGGTLAMMGI